MLSLDTICRDFPPVAAGSQPAAAIVKKDGEAVLLCICSFCLPHGFGVKLLQLQPFDSGCIVDICASNKNAHAVNHTDDKPRGVTAVPFAAARSLWVSQPASRASVYTHLQNARKRTRPFPRVAWLGNVFPKPLNTAVRVAGDAPFGRFFSPRFRRIM